MAGFLLVAFLKLIMNPYPTLHDLSILSFLILMNLTLVLSKVEAFVFICCGILYGTINTWLLLITWLHRFSGNANFFFFQIIVLDAFIVILFIQVFMAIDTKRKKYANELLRDEDKKKPKTDLIDESDSKLKKNAKVDDGKRSTKSGEFDTTFAQTLDPSSSD